jgi:hypothetical protein
MRRSGPSRHPTGSASRTSAATGCPPGTSPTCRLAAHRRPNDLRNGFKVVEVDVAAGTAKDFARNVRPGPASTQGLAGIERPVDCKFAPDGRSLYVLDFGVVRVEEAGMFSFAHTGVLWRIAVR